MLEPMPKSRVIKWVVLTVVAPLAVSLFAANFYIAAWYFRMALAGTPHEGPPPVLVIQRGVMLTAGVGLWFTLLLWWFLHRKGTSFAVLFRTGTGCVWKDLGVGVILGGIWVGIYGAIGWPSFAEMFVVSSAKLASLPTSLSAGLCEEFLFRGFVILLITRARGGWKSQMLWSSLAFGLGHLLWGPVGVLFTIALGASFAGVTLWRGNVWTAVAAHTVLNLCIEPGLMEKVAALSR